MKQELTTVINCKTYEINKEQTHINVEGEQIEIMEDQEGDKYINMPIEGEDKTQVKYVDFTTSQRPVFNVEFETSNITAQNKITGKWEKGIYTADEIPNRKRVATAYGDTKEEANATGNLIINSLKVLNIIGNTKSANESVPTNVETEQPLKEQTGELFSAGKWEWQMLGKAQKVNNEDRLIAEVHYKDISTEEAEANARLICEAPAMYHALLKAHNFLQGANIEQTKELYEIIIESKAILSRINSK